MDFVQKMSKVFNASIRLNADDLMIGESEIRLVNALASIAAYLEIDYNTLVEVVEDTIPNHELCEEIESSKTSPNRFPIAGTQTRQKAAADHDRKLRDLDRQREELINKRQDVLRRERDSRTNRADIALLPGSETGRELTNYRDKLIDFLLRVPRERRAKATQNAIKKLLDAATEVMQAHGSSARLSLRSKYAPTEGNNDIGAFINEMISVARLLLTEEDADDYVNNIAVVLYKADIDPFTISMIVKRMIKDIMANTGTKMRWSKEEWRRKNLNDAIGKYVDRVIAKQKGESTIRITYNLSRSKPELTKEIVNSYANTIRSKGYKLTHTVYGIGDSKQIVFMLRNGPANSPDVPEAQPVDETIGWLIPTNSQKPKLKLRMHSGAMYAFIKGNWQRLSAESEARVKMLRQGDVSSLSGYVFSSLPD